MLIEKSHQCPFRNTSHNNLAYTIYSNGHWCFSCRKGSFQNRDFAIKDVIVKAEPALVFPTGATNNFKEFSTEIIAWLYNYYVYDDMIRKHHIYYVPYSYFQTKSDLVFEGESLLFPIIIGNEIVAYQQRFFPNKNFYSNKVNKYIFDCGNHPNSSTVVLVEDYISAIRVGEVENCLWLAGTNLTKNMIQYIIKNYIHIKIWLDSDTPGQYAAKDNMKLLEKAVRSQYYYRPFANLGQRTIKNIVTELDPKEYSNNEIRSILL